MGLRQRARRTTTRSGKASQQAPNQATKQSCQAPKLPSKHKQASQQIPSCRPNPPPFLPPPPVAALPRCHLSIPAPRRQVYLESEVYLHPLGCPDVSPGWFRHARASTRVSIPQCMVLLGYIPGYSSEYIVILGYVSGYPAEYTAILGIVPGYRSEHTPSKTNTPLKRCKSPDAR